MFAKSNFANFQFSSLFTTLNLAPPYSSFDPYPTTQPVKHKSEQERMKGQMDGNKWNNHIEKIMNPRISNDCGFSPQH